MAASGIEGQDTIQVNAPPEKVWALVSDVTRMGEWSPETVKAVWIEGASTPVVGARFKGSNKRGVMRWSTKCTVVACEPGKEFSFVVGTPEKPATRWSYKFAPAVGGTEVTESFEAVEYPWYFKLFIPPKRALRALTEGVQKTLASLKSAAEGSA
jgi:ligand-binding SRPBCC domain-containing protein